MSSLIEQLLSQFLSAVHNAMAQLSVFASGGATDSLAQDPSTPPAGEVIGSVTDDHGLLVNVYGQQNDGSVTMTVKVMEGTADLRGFFMDVGDSTAGVSAEDVAKQDLKIGDESVTSVGARDNNMNGTGEKFDVGVEIGTAGIGKDDISQASFTLDGVTLEQLDGLTFGVRATSVGEDRSDAVKLVGMFDVPEPPPVEPTPSAEGNFPQLPNDITSIVLLYNTTSGDVTGDGFYAAKVADVSWVVEDDLDAWLVDATNYVQANDPNVPQGTELLGVAITHGDGTTTSTEYYAMDGNPGQDTAPTTDLTPDTTVAYDLVMG